MAASGAGRPRTRDRVGCQRGMNHATIVDMGADGTADFLDQLVRRWICEACREEPRTPPLIAERLRSRGWRGTNGGLDSTCKHLLENGWLVDRGAVVAGRRKPSTVYGFNAEREDALVQAVLANAAHHVDPRSELLLIPDGGLGVAARPLCAAGPEVCWAVRTGDSSIALVVVVDGGAPVGVRDSLYESLKPAGAKRLVADTILPRTAMNVYLTQIEHAHAPARLDDGT